MVGFSIVKLGTCISLMFSLYYISASLQWLVNRARDLAQTLIDNIVSTSRNFNRGICNQYDVIVKRITAQSETVEELVKQQDYVENLCVGELLDLRVGYLIY